jgi:sugar-specific transcriptional regulator TrmB
MKTKLPLSCWIVFALLAMGGCQSPYYAVMEKMGIHKREILLDRVKEGKKSQLEAKEQFQNALEKFTDLTNFDGGDLQKIYDRLSKELARCEDRADEVADRVESIEDVADELFHEWEKELKQYKNPEYKQISREKLEQTRSRYGDLIASMKKARNSIEPVLVTFRDQVLFLKHNLNAQAIASLDVQAKILKSDIRILIHEMESSIEEADAFIQTMKKL